MKKNKTVRQDNLSSVDENKRIYKMYKSKKTWVVAPVVLGALAAGLATAPVAHAAEGDTPQPALTEIEKEEQAAKELAAAKVDATAKLAKLVDNSASFKVFADGANKKIAEAKTTDEVKNILQDAYANFPVNYGYDKQIEKYTTVANKKIAEAKTTDEVKNILQNAYTNFPVKYGYDKQIEKYTTVANLTISDADKKQAREDLFVAVTKGDTFVQDVNSTSIDAAIAKLAKVVEANESAAQKIVDEAVAKDLKQYKANKTAEVNALPFLSVTEKEAHTKAIADAKDSKAVTTATEAAKNNNDANKSALVAQVRVIIDQITNEEKHSELTLALGKANTKAAVEAVRTNAQAALDAQNNAAELTAKKMEVVAQIEKDATTYAVKKDVKDSWIKKVNDAKTVAEVEAVAKDWANALIDLAEDGYEVAKKEVEGMKYILDTPKANILESMRIHAKEPAVVKSLLDDARAQDAAEKEVVLAAIKDAKAEIAGLNLSDADKDKYTKRLDTKTKQTEVKLVLEMAQATSKENDLKDYKAEAVKAIKPLKYLSAKEVTDFSNDINNAKDTEAVDAVVAAANKKNLENGMDQGKTLDDKKAAVKEAVDALSALTESQKSQYKSDIDAAKTPVEIKNIYKAAEELNKKQLAANEAKAQVDEPKDDAAVKKVVDAARDRNQDLVDNKEAIKQAKKAAIDVIKNLKYLSDTEKADFITEVYAQESRDAIQNVVVKAEKLNADHRLEAADLAGAKDIVIKAIDGMGSLSDAEKLAYEARINKAKTKEEVVAIFDEAAAMEDKHHDDKLVKKIDGLIANKDYAKAQDSINELRNADLKAEKQAKLDAEKALSAAKAKAYTTIDGLKEYTPAEKAAEKAKVAKMTDPKAIADHVAALVKDDFDRHDAPWIALAEKLIKQGDTEGAKKAIANIRNPEEKARLNALLGLDGWSQQDGKWYYYNKGEVVKGWFLEKSSGNWFYLDPETGAMQTDLQVIGGQTYYLGKLGNMRKGWTKVGNDWYYFHANLGNAQKNWNEIKGKWYFLGQDGKMVTGFYTNKSGATFYLHPVTGAMQTGWFAAEGKWYFARNNGSIQSGWIQDKGNWFYATADGSIVTNTSKVIKGVKYNFDITGKMI